MFKFQYFCPSCIIFLFLLFSNSGNLLHANNTTVIRGPYLQKATPNSITIKWRTDSLSQSILNYGLSLDNLNQIATDSLLKTEHEMEITGLSANTFYYYQIANVDSILIPPDSSLYFKTAPIDGSKQLLRFWALGDCGTGDWAAEATRDDYYEYIGDKHTDGILFLGDNAYNNGSDQDYQEDFFENMFEDKLKNSITWSCFGNHDGDSADSDTQTGPYYDIFSFPKNGECGGIASGTEAYYSFDYGNVHFISLDSHETDREVGAAMYSWCENDIQNTLADWIVVFFHHPPYSKGSHDSDVDLRPTEMRQNFLPMLESHGVDLVLSGHSHSYERSYLLNGHYGLSNTFVDSLHTVGTSGYGNGQLAGDGAYTKTFTGADADKGAVYVVSGSAGSALNGSFDHPAMYYSVKERGSTILEVECDQMHVKFLEYEGFVRDSFTLVKPIQCCPNVTNTPCDDGDPITQNDLWQANCLCVGDTIFGCMDALACNFDPLHTFEDGTCQFSDCSDGRIAGSIYIDENNNGLQELIEGEIGLEAVLIHLIMPGPDGLFGSPDDSTTIINTNSTGEFSFDNLPPGPYQSQVILPYGFFFPNGNTSEFYSITIEAGETVWLTPSGTAIPSINRNCDLVIKLNSGWNIISSNCLPPNLTMESIFAPIMDTVIQVKNLSGTYVPSFGFNSIGNWDITQGYQVKVSDSTSLLIQSGIRVDPLITPITLNAGWNMMAYLLDQENDPVLIFDDIKNNIIQVKNLSGTYVPSFGDFNSIGNLKNTQGYQIKMMVNDTLYFNGL